jgi:DNA repair exonuclease SbcCD nuclease subunit
MLHGDLDAAESAYAPLDRAAMQQLPVAGWLLGHIHAPRCEREPGSPLMLYPGSPQALDPGEPGVHGPWLIELSPGRGAIERVEQVPVSSARYETLSLDLTGIEAEDAVESRVLGELDRFGGSAVAESGAALGYLSVRLRLTGETPVAGRLETVARNLGELTRPIEQATVGVERVAIEAAPAIDWHRWAASDRAPGTVARLLLALDEPEPGPEVRELIDQARRKLAEIHRRRDYLPLHDQSDEAGQADAGRDGSAGAGVDEAMAREYLRGEAKRLMRELLGQVEQVS